MSRKVIKKRAKPQFQIGYDIGYDDGIRASAAELADLRQKLEVAAPRLRRHEANSRVLESLAKVAQAAATFVGEMER